MFKIGDKVTYVPNQEKGIVSVVRDSNVWVVYKCDNNWSKYYNYTGAKTDIHDLIPGWPEEKKQTNVSRLKNPERLREFAEILQNVLAAHDLEMEIEKTIESVYKIALTKKGHQEICNRMSPPHQINNLLIIAQVTDNRMPGKEETFHIQEGGAVLLHPDGTMGPSQKP